MSSNKIINKSFIEKCSKMNIDIIYTRLTYAVNVINHTYEQYDMCGGINLNEINRNLQSIFNEIKTIKFDMIDDVVVYLINDLEGAINRKYRNVTHYILDEICWEISSCYDAESDTLIDIRNELELICKDYMQYPFYEYVVCHIMNYTNAMLNTK